MRSMPIDVAVNILSGPDGRVLMAERTKTQISAGFWELPGGKVEAGESPESAALRELAEEVGVRASRAYPVMRYEHAFPTQRVRLHVFRVTGWDGTPHGREGQRLAWVDPAAPNVAPILPSVGRVLTVLGLPAVYGITQGHGLGRPQEFMDILQAALKDGLRLIQVREPGLTPDQRITLARRVAQIAHPYGARVLIAGSAQEGCRAGLNAIHSTAADLQRLSGRPPVKLWTVSCHTAQDLARAQELGADAAVLSRSPIGVPSGSDGHLSEPLGRLAAGATLRLYLLHDGVDVNPPEANLLGAIGVAVTDWSAYALHRERRAPSVT
jgi:8-oxo-dGTP diphosphatase